LARRAQIAVIGYGEKYCPDSAYETSRRLGREIAKAGMILITGGLQGVMKGASEGAKEAGGLSIGIVPSEDADQANQHCDAVVATGVGYIRNFFVVYSGDVVIIVGGGAGTMIEAATAYMSGKPIIAIRGTGGVADQLAGRYLDEKRIVKVAGAGSPEQAVKKALLMLPKNADGSRASPEGENQDVRQDPDPGHHR
jgi:uncharacterized protein (TIGR00725 family)